MDKKLIYYGAFRLCVTCLQKLRIWFVFGFSVIVVSQYVRVTGCTKGPLSWKSPIIKKKLPSTHSRVRDSVGKHSSIILYNVECLINSVDKKVGKNILVVPS